MDRVITITKDQAERIRGTYGKYSAIDPIEIPGGLYIISEDVINHPEFKEIEKLLVDYEKTSPKIEINEIKEGDTVVKDNIYVSEVGFVKAIKTDVVTSLTDKSLLVTKTDKEILKVK